MKRLFVLAALTATVSAPSFALAPIQATVLASQPNIVQKIIESEKCSTVSLVTPERAAEDRQRLYMGVGAVVGGTVLALATKGTGAGTQLAATGLGILGGGLAGKKVAEARRDKPVWAFGEPEDKMTQVPREAREARSCNVIEETKEVQEGFINLVRVRDQEMMVLTEKPLLQGGTIRVHVNQHGDMELLRND